MSPRAAPRGGDQSAAPGRGRGRGRAQATQVSPQPPHVQTQPPRCRGLRACGKAARRPEHRGLRRGRASASELCGAASWRRAPSGGMEAPG
ncbi:hypothetical protein NN561_015996 [Cricetulus griseus]